MELNLRSCGAQDQPIQFAAFVQSQTLFNTSIEAVTLPTSQLFSCPASWKSGRSSSGETSAAQSAQVAYRLQSTSLIMRQLFCELGNTFTSKSSKVSFEMLHINIPQGTSRHLDLSAQDCIFTQVEIFSLRVFLHRNMRHKSHTHTHTRTYIYIYIYDMI